MNAQHETIATRPVTLALFLWVLGGIGSLMTTYIISHGMDVHKDAATIREFVEIRERVAKLEVELQWQRRVMSTSKRGPYDMTQPR